MRTIQTEKSKVRKVKMKIIRQKILNKLRQANLKKARKRINDVHRKM